MPLFAYYGTKRGAFKEREKNNAEQPQYHLPTSALYGSLSKLDDFNETLAWFEYAEIAELRLNRGRVAKEYIESAQLGAVRKTIVSLLGDRYSKPRFGERGKFVVKSKQGVELEVSQLSQGYQSILALGMDFARRLALGNPQLENLDQRSPIAQDLTESSQIHNKEESDLPPFGPLWSPVHHVGR